MKLAVAGLLLLGACAASPTPAQQIDLGFWAANDARCEAQSSTKPELDACRDGSRIAACGPGGSFADAGAACADVRLSDGGRP